MEGYCLETLPADHAPSCGKDTVTQNGHVTCNDMNKTCKPYHSFSAERVSEEQQLQDSRFIPFSKRSEKCAIPPEAFQPLSEGKYMTEWRGVPMIKCCMDLIAYQQLIWEVKPRTIIEVKHDNVNTFEEEVLSQINYRATKQEMSWFFIRSAKYHGNADQIMFVEDAYWLQALEFGTAFGGCALWMNDMVISYGLDTHIYSLDIDTDLCDNRAKVASSVTFVQGDSNKIEEAFTPTSLQSLPHPWFVIEDAHINVVRVMEYLHRFLLKGDYLVIEDTNPLGPAKLIQGYSVPGFKGVGQAKLEQVKEFMKGHDEEYAVDAKYQDMFGMNGSWNMNSTFVKL